MLRTVEGQQVVPGETIFSLFDTHGIPIDISTMRFKEEGFLIDWFGIFVAACKRNWNPDKIFNTIELLFEEFYPNQKEEYVLRLKHCISKGV